MPIIKSAKKRVRVTLRKQKRNTVTKNTYKSLIKDFNILVETGKIEDAKKLFPEVQKSIDMATKKNILHANNAARKKSSLAKKLNVTDTSKK